MLGRLKREKFVGVVRGTRRNDFPAPSTILMTPVIMHDIISIVACNQRDERRARGCLLSFSTPETATGETDIVTKVCVVETT